MSQLKPMSEDDIRHVVARKRSVMAMKAGLFEEDWVLVPRLILAWIWERAGKEKAETWDGHHRCSDNPTWMPGSHQCNDPRHNWTDADWIAAVKVRIGWVDSAA